MQAESKQFENWTTNTSALTEQEVTATRRVMHTVYTIYLYNSERNMHLSKECLIELTKIALEEGKQVQT